MRNEVKNYNEFSGAFNSVTTEYYSNETERKVKHIKKLLRRINRDRFFFDRWNEISEDFKERAGVQLQSFIMELEAVVSWYSSAPEMFSNLRKVKSSIGGTDLLDAKYMLNSHTVTESYCYKNSQSVTRTLACFGECVLEREKIYNSVCYNVYNAGIVIANPFKDKSSRNFKVGMGLLLGLITTILGGVYSGAGLYYLFVFAFPVWVLAGLLTYFLFDVIYRPLRLLLKLVLCPVFIPMQMLRALCLKKYFNSNYYRNVSDSTRSYVQGFFDSYMRRLVLSIEAMNVDSNIRYCSELLSISSHLNNSSTLEEACLKHLEKSERDRMEAEENLKRMDLSWDRPSSSGGYSQSGASSQQSTPSSSSSSSREDRIKEMVKSKGIGAVAIYCDGTYFPQWKLMDSWGHVENVTYVRRGANESDYFVTKSGNRYEVKGNISTESIYIYR